MPARVILIGGSSHAGKSTLADILASRLGWRRVATDSLGRHPGRPWAVPAGPAEHFRSSAIDDLIADVLAHYQRLWPHIEALIASGENLVLEGSALWPEAVARNGLTKAGVGAGWLTAGSAHFKARIHAESKYGDADDRLRQLIDNFVARTVRYDELMMAGVARHGLVSLSVEDRPLDNLADEFLALVGA